MTGCRKKNASIWQGFSRMNPSFPATASPMLERLGQTPLASGSSLADLLRRPGISYADLAEIDKERITLPSAAVTTLEVSIKYEGYIKRQIAEVARQAKLEEKKLPEDIDYAEVRGLRLEAAQKLNKIRPTSIGQASRISGVNPADISVLLIYLGIK